MSRGVMRHSKVIPFGNAFCAGLWTGAETLESSMVKDISGERKLLY